MTGREAIYAALFARVSSVAPFATIGRTRKHVDDVPAVNQPALFQTQGKQIATGAFAQPTKWTLHADLWIYAHASNPHADGNAAALLNQLIDAVETALAPEPAMGRQTLGGLVSHCSIAGMIETDEGLLGDQAVAVIPVEITVIPN